jgi:hypothetical protein
VSTYNRQATIGRQCVQRLQSRWRAAAGRGREARANPRGNLIFKDVTSDGDDCDSHVDEGEQDEEGKDASGEAHKRDKRQRRSRGVRMCVSWSVPDAEQRLQGCRSSSMTGQLAAQRVHVLWEKYWLAAWQDE